MIISGVKKFYQGITGFPLRIKIWIAWMMFINVCSVLFIAHREAQFVLVAFCASAVSMIVLTEAKGFSGLLGLPHIIFFTPLLVYLPARLSQIYIFSYFGIWLILLMCTMFISLIFDIIDVAHYLENTRL